MDPPAQQFMIWLVKTLLWLLSRLPTSAPYGIARRCAGLWMRLSPSKRRVTEQNLHACLADLTEEQHEKLVKESFVHYVCSILETGRNWYWPLERLQNLCTEIVGVEHLDRAVKSEQGLLILAPHFGGWEFLGMYSQRAYDMAILYKPASHAGLDKALLQSRLRGGGKVLPANPTGLRQLYAHLRAGKTAGVLPDQQPNEGQGKFVPFFGVPALTGVMAPKLAQKTNSIGVFLVAERLEGGRYRIHAIPAEEEIYSADMEVAVAAINRGVEKCAEIDQAQYLWSYKRFRSRPEGESAVYFR
jgi:KDO2-lipid IV(A) lauroyltransferase